MAKRAGLVVGLQRLAGSKRKNSVTARGSALVGLLQGKGLLRRAVVGLTAGVTVPKREIINR